MEWCTAIAVIHNILLVENDEWVEADDLQDFGQRDDDVGDDINDAQHNGNEGEQHRRMIETVVLFHNTY